MRTFIHFIQERDPALFAYLESNNPLADEAGFKGQEAKAKKREVSAKTAEAKFAGQEAKAKQGEAKAKEQAIKKTD